MTLINNIFRVAKTIRITVSLGPATSAVTGATEVAGAANDHKYRKTYNTSPKRTNVLAPPTCIIGDLACIETLSTCYI